MGQRPAMGQRLPDLWLVLALGLTAWVAAIAFHRPSLVVEDSSQVAPCFLPLPTPRMHGRHLHTVTFEISCRAASSLCV